jgi:hypothetical protein
MRLKVTRTDTYIPEWYNNKKDSAPIKVSFKWQTSEQEEKFSKMRPTYRGNMAEEDIQEVEMDLESHICAIWDECVISVENVIDDDTGKPITDPKKVREIPGTYGLVTEVVAHIKAGFEALEEKN